MQILNCDFAIFELSMISGIKTRQQTCPLPQVNHIPTHSWYLFEPFWLDPFTATSHFMWPSHNCIPWSLLPKDTKPSECLAKCRSFMGTSVEETWTSTDGSQRLLQMGVGCLYNGLPGLLRLVLVDSIVSSEVFFQSSLYFTIHTLATKLRIIVGYFRMQCLLAPSSLCFSSN